MSEPSLRQARRDAQQQVSRSHILDAAEKVFGHRGFHEATLKQIAEEAEFSVGALYGFFEGKDDLFARVLERQGNALLEQCRAAVAEDVSPRRQLHGLVDAQLAYFREHPDFYRLFLRELGGATWSMRANLNERGLERYQAVMDFEAEIFAEGVRSGELRNDAPDVLAALFSGIMQAYLAQWVFGLDDSGRSAVEDRYPVSELHALMDRAFVAGNQSQEDTKGADR